MTSPNTEPIFKKIPFKAVVSLSNQVISRNGGDTTSSALLLVQAGENGLIIESIQAIPVATSGTVPNTVLRLLKKGANSNRLTLVLPEVQLVSIDSAAVNDATALVTIDAPLPNSIQGVLGTKALLLGPNESLYAALSQSVSPNGYNITCQGGFY
jgi:hypothetical protein